MSHCTKPYDRLMRLIFLLTSDPGASDEVAAKGAISLSFGKLFEKESNLSPTSACSHC